MDKQITSETLQLLGERYFSDCAIRLEEWKEKRLIFASAKDTRSRILNAARTVFATSGQSATIRDICKVADANVSAVNYYFGSKDKLLAELLALFWTEVRGIYPLDGGVKAFEPPEERLFGLTLGGLSSVLISHGKEYRSLNAILLHYFLNKSEEFAEVSGRNNNEFRDNVSPGIDEMTHGRCTVKQIEALFTGFIANLYFYATHVEELLAMRGNETFSNEEVIGIAKHITAFSVGGIKNYLELMDAEVDFPNMCGTDCGSNAR